MRSFKRRPTSHDKKHPSASDILRYSLKCFQAGSPSTPWQLLIHHPQQIPQLHRYLNGYEIKGQCPTPSPHQVAKEPWTASLRASPTSTAVIAQGPTLYSCLLNPPSLPHSLAPHKLELARLTHKLEIYSRLVSSGPQWRSAVPRQYRALHILAARTAIVHR
jgi:hypothetical protein